ncbi:hypothetical protein [Rhizobium sp. CSW-27]|uniref:hypothetical protein n=1 Tax=Rhizobium sp. CSW-27 TaxID=2839985 RepID=UPI001C02FA35|nr:hypothetical protein [Rhizobium sp. CSW-27]MBT9373130.1 hypothetical protein [Rhizobium sp. CSW-27]
MIYIRIIDGVVVDRALFEGAMPDDWPDRAAWIEHETAQIGWRLEAGTLLPPSEDATAPAPAVDDYRLAIQAVLDQAAQARRYDSGNSLASYAASTNPQWSSEAQAFIRWRDQVWAYAYAELGKVEAGEREQPGILEFLQELPAVAWPAA